MLTNHQITALVLGVLLPMTLLFIGAYALGLHKGKLLEEATEYAKGYRDSTAMAAKQIKALHADIEQHSQARESLIQDADARIAFYARRSNPFNASDLVALEGIGKTLALAQATWRAMGADHSAAVATTQELAIAGMRKRLQASINAAAELAEAPTANDDAHWQHHTSTWHVEERRA